MLLHLEEHVLSDLERSLCRLPEVLVFLGQLVFLIVVGTHPMKRKIVAEAEMGVDEDSIALVAVVERIGFEDV
jgi:hypothetical protein